MMKKLYLDLPELDQKIIALKNKIDNSVFNQIIKEIKEDAKNAIDGVVIKRGNYCPYCED